MSLWLRVAVAVLRLATGDQMPIDYHIDTSHRLIVSMAKGILTPYELLNHQARIRNDPEFDPTFWQLHDIRNADFTEIRPECVEALAEFAIPKRGTRSAIVVESALADELARMFEGLREGTGEQIRIFRNLDSARTWLELAPEESRKWLIGQSSERRPAPRKEVNFSARLQLWGEAHPERLAQVVNISVSGALFECSSIYPVPGALIRILFALSEGDPPLEVRGRIVHCTETGFAVQFLEVTKELLQLVADRS